MTRSGRTAGALQTAAPLADRGRTPRGAPALPSCRWRRPAGRRPIQTADPRRGPGPRRVPAAGSGRRWTRLHEESTKNRSER